MFWSKWIFDILFSVDAKRAGALARVRALAAKYDPIPVSPELKNPRSRRSKLYFLLIKDELESCSYSELGNRGKLSCFVYYMHGLTSPPWDGPSATTAPSRREWIVTCAMKHAFYWF